MATVVKTASFAAFLRVLASRGLGVGRVIARPFIGTPGHFTRTSNRHDYALEPFGETLRDRLAAPGVPVVSIEIGRAHV